MRASTSACIRSQMAVPYGRMTIVPRAGPFSASSALATTSWYQRGKSSLGEVRTLGITRSYSRPTRPPSCIDSVCSRADARSSGLLGDVFVHEVDSLLAGVGVVALLVEQHVSVLVGGGLRSREIRLGQRAFDAVLVDELRPFHEGVDHLALRHDRDVGTAHEQMATLVARSDAEV